MTNELVAIPADGKAESTRRALEAELSFYAQVLGLERDDVARLRIENL